MNVNSVSNATSFKALKISQDAAMYLNTLSNSDLNAIDKAGRAMKNYQYADLYINSNGVFLHNKVDNETYGRNGSVVASLKTDDRHTSHDGFLMALVNLRDGNQTTVLLDGKGREDFAKQYEKLAELKGIKRTIEFTKSLEKTLAKRVKSTKDTTPSISSKPIVEPANEKVAKLMADYIG